jgi:hypothetical protein
MNYAEYIARLLALCFAQKWLAKPRLRLIRGWWRCESADGTCGYGLNAREAYNSWLAFKDMRRGNNPEAWPIWVDPLKERRAHEAAQAAGVLP